ncbi:erythromycin esterase family protein [Solitalea lacus]|uniref:erythromycin esterase family protein n=1 Tax=Solitalea lacus TaxID=2911172 RepID=UPI001EDA1650|nr:erythromycin esterase family protein [Solitalea lacus]UKJ06152.1 erythromycin esterase family protein [Solitalea lacus]
MNYLKTSISILTFFVCIYPAQSIAQDKTAEIISNLNAIIKPINTIKADSSFEDIDFLKETLKDKEIISLGEATHGTREFYDYKDRLIRFLVTNMHYKAISFESDYIAIEKIDDYINSKTDSLISLPGSALLYTNHPMIEWLKKYNQTKAIAEKVHVYGLEVRNFDNIINKILKVFPEIETADKLLLEKVKNSGYAMVKRKDLNELKGTIKNLQKACNNELIKHYITLLSQIGNPDGYEDNGFRDQTMAYNAIWIIERTPNNKLITWAHNGHVAKKGYLNYPIMGTYLNEKYGSKYFVIATDFNHGEVNVRKFIAKNKPVSNFQPLYYPEVNTSKGYEYYFKQCKFKNFILDVDSASKVSILNSFLTEPLDMRLIGALSIPEKKKLSISKNFDLIVFFDKTRRAWD